MKNSILLFLFLFGFVACSEITTQQETQEQATEKKSSLNENTASSYDEDLAKALDADDYGMKPYVFAYLKKGPNRDLDSAAASELQKAHMENIGRLAADNKLVLAGPFLDDGEVRGIYIFDVATIEEAKLLTETDPAIKAGSLVMELHPWYGSAALMKVNEIHNQISK